MNNLFPPSVRSLKIFKFSDDDGKPRKAGIPIKLFSGIAFIPVVKSTADIANEVKTLFGNVMYSRYWYNYVYPKRYIFKNAFLPGAKVNITESTNERNYEISGQLEHLKTQPSYIVRNTKNTIYDYSKIINLSYPTHDVMVKQRALDIAETIGVEYISYLLLGKSDNDVIFSQCQTTLPPPSNFSNIIIDIPVESTNTRLMMAYLKDSVKLTRSLKTHPEDMMILSIARFLMSYFEGDIFAESPILSRLSDFMNTKENVIFLFHNKTHAFIFDNKDLKVRDFKYDVVFRMMKIAFTNLLGLNSGELSETDAAENEKKEDITEDDIKTKNNDEIIHKEIVDDNKVVDSIIPITKDAELNNIVIKDAINKMKTSFDKIDKMNNIAGKKVAKVNDDEDQDIDYEDEEDMNEYINEEDINEEGEKYEEVGDNSIEIPDEAVEENDEGDINFLSDDLIGELTNEDINNEEVTDNELNDLKIVKASTEPVKTPAQLRRIELIKDKYKSIIIEDDKTIEDILNEANVRSIDVNESPVKLKDDSLKFSTLMDFERSYVAKTMTRDTIKIVKSFSEDKDLNLHIIDAQKEDTSDQFTEKQTYTFQLEDEEQKKHKIKFDMPKVDENGFMKINGNKKLLKKQLIMLPVTKIKPYEVMVTSNFNKVFIRRQGSILNRNIIIMKKIFSMFIGDERIQLHHIDITSGNNSRLNKDFITSIEYDELSKMFHRITMNKGNTKVRFYFNQKEIRDEIFKNTGKKYNSTSNMPIGFNYTNNLPIEVDLKGNTSVCDTIFAYVKQMEVINDFDNFINTIKIPKRRMYSRITLMSKEAPLIVFLSTLFTLTKVLNTMKCEAHFVPKKTPNVDITFDRTKMIFVNFMDGTFYYPQYPIENSLLLNGLTEMDTTKINFSEMDTVLPYVDYIYDQYKSRNLYKGWRKFQELFIDYKTKDILIDLKLPTDFLELFLYANDLLSDNNYEDESYIGNWRLRGFEILNTLLYDTIAQQYADYSKYGKSRTSFSIPQDAIFKALHKSFIMENYDATNPVNEIKSKSIVTFKGPHGINMKEAFKLSTRGESLSMVGTIAISSLDNSGVGISKQLTDNPRVNSTYGYLIPTDEKDVKKLTYGNLMAPEEAVIPFINRDDPKRISFASGQTKHVIPITGSMTPLVGTGAEQSLIYKIGDEFGYKAKSDGVIKAIFEKEGFLIIDYGDGKTNRVEFGQKMNRNSNFFIGNNLKLDDSIKVGMKVKKGRVITYNQDFFKKHLGKLIMTQGAYARLAITEGENTEEDSCVITEDFANKLNTTIIKRKQIVLNPQANIIRYIGIGDFVKHGDPLMSYEDQKEEGANSELISLLGEIDESTLDKIMRHAPKANTTGKIIDMKVYWTIDPQNMSESCHNFIIGYTKKIIANAKKEEEITGKVSSLRKDIVLSTPYRGRINGAELPEEGGILIEYYIGEDHSMIAGDKLTFNSSLKSIVSAVIPKELSPYRLNGDGKIDAMMSMMSINSRMLTSVFFSGYISKILFDYGKRIASEYFEDLKKK